MGAPLPGIAPHATERTGRSRSRRMQAAAAALVTIGGNLITVPVANGVQVSTFMNTNANSDITFRWKDIEIFVGSAETPLYNFKQELHAADPGDTSYHRNQIK